MDVKRDAPLQRLRRGIQSLVEKYFNDTGARITDIKLSYINHISEGTIDSVDVSDVSINHLNEID